MAYVHATTPYFVCRLPGAATRPGGMHVHELIYECVQEVCAGSECALGGSVLAKSKEMR